MHKPKDSESPGFSRGGAIKIEELLDEATTALADIAEAISEGSGNKDDLVDAINSIAKALQDRKPNDFKAITDSIRAIKLESPQVTVNVQPTPISVNLPEMTPVFEIPERVSAGWDIDLKYDYRGLVERMTVKPMKD